MLPSGPTPHHSNMLCPEEDEAILNTNVQQIVKLRKNKWKLSNRDILDLEPCVMFPRHIPVMSALDHK